MDNSSPIQVVDDLALVPLTQTEVASLNLQSIGVITITSGGGGGGNGDMLKSVFATLNPAAGFVDKAITASNVSYTGLTSLPGGSINFLRADGTFAPPPGQVYNIVSIGTAGLAPALIPSGGANTYLRGDGSWAPPTTLSINYSQLMGTPLKFDPIIHGFQHVTGGNDPIALANSTATGLVQMLPSAPNQVTSFLRGDNSWQPLPAASLSAPGLVPTLTGVNTAFFNAAGGYSVPVFSSLSGLPSAFTPLPHALTHVTPGAQQDLLPQFSKSGGLAGVVPASLGDTVNYLRADGTWSAPPGGGGLATDTGAGLLRQLQAPANQTLYYLLGNNTWDLISNLSINFNKLIGVPIFIGGAPGLVPSSLGGTANYLRADGVYSQPTGSPVSTSNFGTVAPQPSTGQLGYFLRGDNTWQLLSGITVDYTNQVTGKPVQFDPIPHHARHTTGGADVIPAPTISSTGLVPILPSVTPSLFFLSGTGNFATIPIASPTSSGLVPIPPNQPNQWFRGDAQFATIPLADTLNPGLAPVRSGNTTTFLRGDGTYRTVDYTSLTSGTVPLQFDPIPHANRHVTGGADPIQNFSTTSATSGLVPGSSGLGAGKFLQADGFWTTPTGSGDVLHTLTITGANSVSGGGDLSQNRSLQLTNDVPTPGANSVYSYVSGNRGWNAFSSFPVVGVGVPGLVPAANATTAQFLNGTGVFSTPPTFTPTTSGIVPASGGGQINFLRADNTWSPIPPTPLATTTNAGIVPTAPSTLSNTHYLAGNNTWVLNLNFPVSYSQISGVPIFTGSLPGLVPSSLGSGSQFLRGDGTFFAPPLAASAQPGYIQGLPSSAGTNFWARGDNSWQLLPDSVLVTSQWLMPTIGTPVSPVNVSDTSTLESGQTLIVVGSAGTNCLMEVGTIVSPGSPGSISLINRGYAMNPSSGTQIPGGLMFIAGPGVMTSTVPGFVPTPPNDSSKFLSGLGTWLTPTGSGGAGTVTTSSSVQGDGSVGNPVQLVNDSSNPGSFKFYSTDGGGTKGWLPLVYSWETNAIFNMPGVGANQNILLVSNVGILIGMTLVIEDNTIPASQAFVQVVSVNGDNLHIVVNNPGYAINATGGTPFATNAAVTLAGPAMATASTPGFVPTPPNDTFRFLRGDAQFQVPNNVDTVHPGYAPVAPNDSTQFLNGLGNWSIPTITTLATTGTQGAVRGLSATNQGTSFLRGDNQWALLNTITVDYTTQVTGKASAFVPTAHHGTHISTGSDPIDLFSISTAVSGLVPGSSGASTTFLRGDGTWAAVPGSPGLATAGVDGLLKGLIASPTLQYLRGDNSWQPLAGITVDYTTQVTGRPPTFAPSTHGAQHVTGGTDPIPVVAGTSTGLVPLLPTVTPALRFLDGTANFSVIPTVTNLASGLMPARDGNASHFYSSDGTQKVIPTMTSTVGGLTPAVTPNSPLQWLRGDATYATLPEYWNISAGFTQPAPGSNTPSVTFTTTVGMQVGMCIATTDTGSPPVTNYYTVATIIDGTHATLLNFGALGNTPAVSTVNAGIVALNGPPIVTATGGGLVPRPPNDASQFLNGIGQFAIPTTSGVLLTSQTLGTQLSLTGGGTIAANLTLSLVNDTSPSAFQVYGSNGASTPIRGWYSASSFPLFSTSSSTAGLAPGTSGVAPTNFLCANGTWTAPSSIGPASGSSPGTVPQLPATPPAFPTQVQWLRADNTWQFPNNSNATTASWVMPAVGSTVPGVTFTSPNGTANFDAGMTLLFATGNGTTVCFMEVVSIDTGTTMTLKNQGYSANASLSGNTVPAGPVYIAGPGIATATFSGLVPTLPTVSPAVKFLRGDSNWVQVDYSNLTGSPVLPTIQISWALTGATFTQPAVGSGTPINLAVTSSASAVVNRGVIIPGAGYYFISAVPDGTHITLQNNGHAYNAAPGTTGLGGAGVFIIGAANANLFTSAWAGDVPKSTGTTTDFLRADGTWTTPPGTVPSTRQIIANSTTGSIIGGGDLSADRTLTLSGDATTPGNWFLYSTNGSGTKGWNASTSLPQATTSLPGLLPTLPAAPNNIDQWLRGDATWVQAPPLAKTITATFTWPASGGTSASIAVDSSGNMRVGMALYFPGLGVAELMTIPDGTHITIRNNTNSGNVTISTTGVAIGTSIYVGGGGSLCTTSSAGDVPNPSGFPVNSFLSSQTASFAVPSNVSTSGPGFAPTAPASASQFLNGLTGTWTSVPYSILTGSPVSDPFTTVSSFTMVAAGTPVTLTIGAATWPVVGQVVQINDGTNFGFFEITTVTSSTSIAVTNRGYLGTPVSGLMGAATMTLSGPGQATSTKAGLIPAPPNNTFTFLRGDGTFAKPHGTMTTTTATFTVPAAHALTASIAINSVTWPIVGQKVYVTDGTLVMYGNITTVTDATHITLRNTGDTGNSVAGTMGVGATVVLVGYQTPVFRQWQAGLEYSPPATLYAVFGSQNARPHLAYNDAATWTANFFGVVPSGTYLGAGLIVRLKWKSITVATGNARWNVAIERLNTAESADSFDTAVPITTACSGTTSALVESAITITTIDSITAGDGIGVQVQRLGADAADTLVGDACLRLVTIESVI